MRVTMVNGDTRIVIADDGDAVSGLETSLEPQVQVVTGVRATNATPLPRDNKVRALAFTVTYLPSATLQIAQAKTIDFPETVPANGYLQVDNLGFNGIRQVRYLVGAVTGRITGRITGVTAILNFNFTGRYWSKTVPTS